MQPAALPRPYAYRRPGLRAFLATGSTELKPAQPRANREQRRARAKKAKHG